MFRLSLLLFAIGAWAMSAGGAAADPDAVAPIVKRYDIEIRKLQTEHSRALSEQRKIFEEAGGAAKKSFDELLSEAASSYGMVLDRLATKAKADGDLDAVLSLKTERGKVTDTGVTGKAGILPPEAAKARTAFDVTATKAKLGFDSVSAKALKDFETSEKSILQRFTANVRERHAGYLRELLDLEKSETKDDKIESAVAVRAFRVQVEKAGPPPPEDAEAVTAAALAHRRGAAKSNLLKKYGGTMESERAVARGLAYLARQQKPSGSWVFDGSSSADTIAATGIALLAFLGADESSKRGKYSQTVDRGVKFLVANQRADGSFKNASGMYSHGIAATSLCEAYLLSGDQAILKRAQAAIDFMVDKQAADGSWGYSPGTTGDTSIVGWQLQALKAASLSKDFTVPPRCLASAAKFLDKVSTGQLKSAYGYTAPNGVSGSSLTAVGLLGRNFVSHWGAGHEGLAEGVKGLLQRGPLKAPALPNMYYYYYATQVVRLAGGDEWVDWNEGLKRDGKRSDGMRDFGDDDPKRSNVFKRDGKRSDGMRDWLVSLQEKKEGANQGSWASDDNIIGGSCGRVGCTALAVLTLEVYYRYLPDDKAR